MLKRYSAVFVGSLLAVGCNQAASRAYTECIGFEQQMKYVDAINACSSAVAADPEGKTGAAAKAKIVALEKRRDEMAAAVNTAAAAKKAADEKAAAAAAVVAAAQAEANEARLKTLRAKITKKYWGAEPDGGCTGKGLPPYKWDYEGGTFAEDRELAVADGCRPAFGFAENTSYCCPQKPITGGW